MSKITKSFSEKYDVSLAHKPLSQSKLPKLTTRVFDNRDNQRIIIVKQGLNHQQSKSKTFGIQGSQQLVQNFSRKQNISVKQGKTSKNKQITTQQSDTLGSKITHNKSLIKLKPIAKQELQKINNNGTKASVSHQIIPASTDMLFELKTNSAQSSRGTLHSVANQIQSLVSQQTLKLILPVKVYKQEEVGNISNQWWSVVDSLFVSLQKIIKVKNRQISPQKQGKSIQKNKQSLKSKEVSPSKEKSKQSSKKMKKIQGIVQSNTKASIQISKVYSLLEEETKKNQQYILKYFQDPSHFCLILEAYFYEKALIYLIGTIRKWNHHEQKLYIHCMALDLIPCIIQCRKLFIQILIEAVENEQQDNKLRKPKYISKEKKLIQISKFTNFMRQQYEKYVNSLGSPHRYKNFQLPQTLKQHSHLINVERKWRNIVFDAPFPPFLSQKNNRKSFLLVIQPLNILYKYNKKQQSLQIDPYAQIFLTTVSVQFDILFFTCADKQSSLLNFLGILDKTEIVGVLDKDYLTYKAAKPIKDINKIGGGYAPRQILVVDDKCNSKYYNGSKHSVLLVDAFHTETKIARVNGKLIKMDDHDDDYLKKLSTKIISCAEKGGHWDQIISQKHERKKIHH